MKNTDKQLVARVSRFGRQLLSGKNLFFIVCLGMSYQLGQWNSDPIALANAQSKTLKEKKIGRIPDSAGKAQLIGGSGRTTITVLQSDSGDIYFSELRGNSVAPVLQKMARGSAKKPMKIADMGLVPKDFGKPIALTGTNKSLTAAFVDDSGNLTLVDCRNNRVSKNAYRISREAKGNKSKKKKQIKLSVIGSIPSSYGSPIGIAGAPRALTIAFANDKGDVFLIDFNGGKLSPVAKKIEREYK